MLRVHVVAEQLRRVPSAGRAARVGGHAERVEHQPDHRWFGDFPEDTESATAAGARKHIDLEAPTQKRCPVDAWRGRVEGAAKWVAVPP